MVRAIVCLNLDQLTQVSWLGLFFLALAPDIFFSNTAFSHIQVPQLTSIGRMAQLSFSP